MTDDFHGFPRGTIAFLQELSRHNNREWFAANKHRYETLVVEPALAFITAMEPGLESISKRFTALASRQGGSLMRIYRDTRFGGDKTPYKTNVGIQFRHEQGKDVHAPGFYFHVAPGECFLGAGMWRPEPTALHRIRKSIDDKPDDWRAVRRDKPMNKSWYFDGDSLKRAPKGYSPNHPLIEDLKRTDFILVHDLRPSHLTRPALIKQVTREFRATSSFMRFLCKAVGVPF